MAEIDMNINENSLVFIIQNLILHFLYYTCYLEFSPHQYIFPSFFLYLLFIYHSEDSKELNGHKIQVQRKTYNLQNFSSFFSCKCSYVQYMAIS